jgi:hypothetical protein
MRKSSGYAFIPSTIKTGRNRQVHVNVYEYKSTMPILSVSFNYRSLPLFIGAYSRSIEALSRKTT